MVDVREGVEDGAVKGAPDLCGGRQRRLLGDLLQNDPGLTIENGQRPVLQADHERGRTEHRKDDEDDRIWTPKKT